jgi:Family of unknown function (DUF6535)
MSTLQTGLFSAAVAALLSLTVQDLQQGPQDTSAFYLEKMYQFQVLADSNAPRPSTPAQPPPFSPPKYAIWVNSLWFLSLCISLTGAMLATLQQQWARRYLRVTQPPRSSPHDQARMREFFANGVDRLHFSRVVDAVPTLIHLSLFLFFSGLLIYLFNINLSVFFAVVWWIGVSAGVYLVITFMPILRLDSPYRVPLSSPVCRASAAILYLAFRILGLLVFFGDTVRTRLYDKSNHYRKWVSRGMKKITEKVVEESSLEIDGRVLKWIFNTLAEDHELEKFFQKIPSFCSSKVVKDPLRVLHNSVGEWGLSLALSRFLERTWLSNLVPESDKQWRFVLCVNVVDMACLHHAALWIHNEAFQGNWYGVRRSVEMGHSLRRRGKRGDQGIGLFAQIVVAQIIADVQGSNDRWVALATDQLGDALPRYLQHGNDSVLLANLIHITGQIFSFSSGANWNMANSASDFALAQPSLRNFNVRNALPELQHKFCDLWNEIVSAVQNREDPPNANNTKSAKRILLGIRKIYIDLHKDSDAAPKVFSASTTNYNDDEPDPPSYPLCQLSDHHPLVGDGTVAGCIHHIPTISSHEDITNPICQPSVSSGTTPQHNEETTTTPAQISDSSSSPTLIPASRGAHIRHSQSPAGSAVSHSGALPRGPVSPSSTTARVALQVPSLSDTNATPTILPILSLNNTAAPRGDDDYVEDVPSSTGPSAKDLGKRALIGEESDRLGVDNDTQDPNAPPQPEPPRDTSSQHHQSLS